MVFLTQIVNKPVFYQGHYFGKIADLIVSSQDSSSVSKLIIQKNRQKFITDKINIEYKDGFVLKNLPTAVTTLSDDLIQVVEDLLDKQVIDINNRRLVRVNDVVLSNEESLHLTGIDIGFSGIVRRLKLSWLFGLKNIIIPWRLVETFDYSTGEIRVNLDQNSLNNFHPAEIADILEEAGSKERVGIVESLDANVAAQALEESDSETQIAVLEESSFEQLKDIVSEMNISEIADIYPNLDTEKAKDVDNALGIAKTSQLQRLVRFSEHVAGGLMNPVKTNLPETETVGKVLDLFAHKRSKPETLFISSAANKFRGTVATKDLAFAKRSEKIKRYIKDRHFLLEKSSFDQIQFLLSNYNLRNLPVLNDKHQVVGIVTIDDLLREITKDEEREDVV